MSIEIKQASIADINELVPLFDNYRVFYEKPSDLTIARNFLTERLEHQESIIFIAHVEDLGVCGFTQLYPSFSSVSARRTWILNDLYVDKAARQRGVGRALMNQAQVFSKDSGAIYLGLETAKTNHNAQALYESLGYQKNQDAYFYWISLDP